MSVPKKLLHPRPDKWRSTYINLNGEWDFSLDAPTYDRRITVPFSWASPLSGIAENHKGTGYYRRTLTLDTEGMHPFLIIGAANYECEVLLNGTTLATHRGGYMPIEVDLFFAWKEGENLLEIRVTDKDIGGQTYGKQAYGAIRGIWQTVYLELRPAAYLADFFIRTSTDGTVTIDCTPSRDAVAPHFFADFGGISAEDDHGRITLHFDDPHLWSTEDPFLYEGVIRMESEAGSDTVHTYFGIREIGIDTDRDGIPHLTLNKKPIYIRGVLDQAYHPEGFFTLPSDEDCEEEILRVKRLGLNCARIHVKSEEPRKLYAADRNGILLLQDFPCFWPAPTAEFCEQYERELVEAVIRDRNHPAIILWIVFNESWGLLSFGKEKDGSNMARILPATEPWVRRCFHLVKALDPTRLVEDNSPCRNDHIVTDINSWHFYINDREELRQNLRTYANGTAAGSSHNFIPPNRQEKLLPLLNSECGFVWGIDGGAGDCDLAWQYLMMMNEFRLEPRLCGFVYTQLHDVTNEFNGYYRIDNTEKVFGFDGVFDGMSIHDLHSDLFLAYDAAPGRTVKGGERIETPLLLSSVYDYEAKEEMVALCEYIALEKNGKRTCIASERFTVTDTSRGVHPLDTTAFTAPCEDTLVILGLTLLEGERTVMRSFAVIDCEGTDARSHTVALDDIEADGFDRTFPCIAGEKWNALGKGTATFTLDCRDIPFDISEGFTLRFEASARPTYRRDLPGGANRPISFSLGAPILDPAEKPNSFPMTDMCDHPVTMLSVAIGDLPAVSYPLPYAPADCRGVLSHMYQPNARRIDESGSYGTLIEIRIDGADAKTLPDRFSVALSSDGGLSLFGRKSGRYPTAVTVTES